MPNQTTGTLREPIDLLQNFSEWGRPYISHFITIITDNQY